MTQMLLVCIDTDTRMTGQGHVDVGTPPLACPLPLTSRCTCPLTPPLTCPLTCVSCVRTRCVLSTRSTCQQERHLDLVHRCTSNRYRMVATGWLARWPHRGFVCVSWFVAAQKIAAMKSFKSSMISFVQTNDGAQISEPEDAQETGSCF